MILKMHKTDKETVNSLYIIEFNRKSYLKIQQTDIMHPRV